MSSSTTIAGASTARPFGTLAVLKEQDAGLARTLATGAHTTPDAAALAAVANQLERTIAKADPKQAKALLRLLIKELKVNGRLEILPTYRVVTDAVCALPSSMGRTDHYANQAGMVVTGPPVAV